MTHRSRIGGFTLVEMMIVISIMLVLLGIAIPRYAASIQTAREDNLRKNLSTLNQVIYQYTLDKQRAPKSLEEVRSAGYIETIPDDITGSRDTWAVEEEQDTIFLPEQTDTGIVGVHSGSDQIGSDGRAYSEW